PRTTASPPPWAANWWPSSPASSNAWPSDGRWKPDRPLHDFAGRSGRLAGASRPRTPPVAAHARGLWPYRAAVSGLSGAPSRRAAKRGRARLGHGGRGPRPPSRAPQRRAPAERPLTQPDPGRHPGLSRLPRPTAGRGDPAADPGARAQGQALPAPPGQRGSGDRAAARTRGRPRHGAVGGGARPRRPDPALRLRPADFGGPVADAV